LADNYIMSHVQYMCSSGIIFLHDAINIAPVMVRYSLDIATVAMQL